MTDAWPGGLAYKVVESLKEIYQPKDSVTEVELYERLMNVKMKNKGDPKVLFEQVASIANWYNNGTKKIPLEQQIAVVLKAAPKEYASVLTSEQEKQGSNLKLSHLRVVMGKYYRAVYKKKDTSADGDDEMALTAQSGGGKSNYSGKKKFKGKCNNCGKQGHMARDCWNDPKNADKRPKWYKANRCWCTFNAGQENGNGKCDQNTQNATKYHRVTDKRDSLNHLLRARANLTKEPSSFDEGIDDERRRFSTKPCLK